MSGDCTPKKSQVYSLSTFTTMRGKGIVDADFVFGVDGRVYVRYAFNSYVEKGSEPDQHFFVDILTKQHFDDIGVWSWDHNNDYQPDIFLVEKQQSFPRQGNYSHIGGSSGAKSGSMCFTFSRLDEWKKFSIFFEKHSNYKYCGPLSALLVHTHSSIDVIDVASIFPHVSSRITIQEDSCSIL